MTTDPNQRKFREMYLRGAVQTLHKVAHALEEHPQMPAAEFVRQLADHIVYEVPEVLE